VGIMGLYDDLVNRVVKEFQHKGIRADETNINSNLRMTNIPPDHVMQEANRRNAHFLAKDKPCKLYCPMCGKHHDDVEDDQGNLITAEESLKNCTQEHVLNFLGGVPEPKTEEHIEFISDKMHPALANMTKHILRKQNKAHEDYIKASWIAKKEEK
jgi:hypothetical protein